MKLSKSLEQACCVLGIIATKPEGVVTASALSAQMRVSPSYLAKITRKLVVSGLIRSAHGVGGGYVLAIPMEDITLRAVVEATEGAKPFFEPQGIIERVFSQTSAARKGVSGLESAFAGAETSWLECLKHTTLRQIIDDALERGGR